MERCTMSNLIQLQPQLQYRNANPHHRMNEKKRRDEQKNLLCDLRKLVPKKHIGPKLPMLSVLIRATIFIKRLEEKQKRLESFQRQLAEERKFLVQRFQQLKRIFFQENEVVQVGNLIMKTAKNETPINFFSSES